MKYFFAGELLLIGVSFLLNGIWYERALNVLFMFALVFFGISFIKQEGEEDDEIH